MFLFLLDQINESESESESNGVKGSCNFENLLHAKRSNFDNTQTKSSKISGTLGGDEKMIREKFRWKFLNSDRANWKKATPRFWWNRL